MQAATRTAPDPPSHTPEQPAETPQSQGRSAARPRPTKALPTDRMKFEMQVGALRSIAVVSDFGKRAVGGEDIAPTLGVSGATAALNNQFFMESGLIARKSKGRYLPSDAVVKFAQRHSFDPEEAGHVLAPILADTWFFREVKRAIPLSPARNRMIEVLAYAAGTTKDRSAQLGSLLAWLEYAGLIVVENGTVRLGERASETNGGDEDGLADRQDPPADPADPNSETPTKGEQTERQQKPPKDEQPMRGPTLLALSFDLSLTADDLGRLSAEQITALFEAVGKVAAIKGAIKT